jgi:hypothetical protein
MGMTRGPEPTIYAPMRIYKMKTFLGITKRHVAAIGVVVLAAGAVVGGVALAGESPPPNLTSPSPSGQATSIPSSLSSAFAALRRDRQSSDALTGAAASAISGGGDFAHYGVNPSLSRLVGSVSGAPVWLVPGSSGSCLVLSSGASACAANEIVTQQGVVIAMVPTSGAPATVEGIVPDGASVTTINTAGAQTPVPLSGQAFSVSAADATSFTIHTVSGGTVVQPLPTGKPPAGPSGTPEAP